MGFKSYCDNKKEKEFNNNNTKEQEQKVEEFYNKYKDKNEDELMNELIKNVAKQKQDGTFDYNSISAMLEKITPFLNNEQNLKIKELLQKIK